MEVIADAIIRLYNAMQNNPGFNHIIYVSQHEIASTVSLFKVEGIPEVEIDVLPKKHIVILSSQMFRKSLSDFFPVINFLINKRARLDQIPDFLAVFLPEPLIRRGIKSRFIFAATHFFRQYPLHRFP
jgi:hypothetical protein